MRVKIFSGKERRLIVARSRDNAWQNDEGQSDRDGLFSEDEYRRSPTRQSTDQCKSHAIFWLRLDVGMILLFFVCVRMMQQNLQAQGDSDAQGSTMYSPALHLIAIM